MIVWGNTRIGYDEVRRNYRPRWSGRFAGNVESGWSVVWDDVERVRVGIVRKGIFDS